MATNAFVFPGQGSQEQNMLADFYNHSTFQATIQEANNIIGFDTMDIVRNNQDGLLNSTEYTQPIILAVSIALWRVWLQEGGVPPKLVAGHSLGEYSALVAGRVLTFADALHLVKQRARCMVESVVDLPDTSMQAIIGLEDIKVVTACKQAMSEGVVEAVNFNAPGQVVIAGETAAVTEAAALCKRLGAKRAIKLLVSVPSHCSLMQGAAKTFEKYLAETAFNKPISPIVHNVDANTHEHPDDIRAALQKQLCMPVLWSESLQVLDELGVDTFAECGPNKVLLGLVRRTLSEKNMHSLATKAEFEQALSSI